MIYLLDGSEFSWQNQIEFLDSNDNKVVTFLDFNKGIGKLLEEKLELAAKTNELIHTLWLRGIGKTNTLIQFAKRHGYIVISPNAYTLRDMYNYKDIYSGCGSARGGQTKNIVIDEGVSNIQDFKDAGFKIITGFYTPQKEDEKSFKDKIQATLKNEIEALTPKLVKCRDNGDFGTYRNLIIAYKEVLGLMQSTGISLDQLR